VSLASHFQCFEPHIISSESGSGLPKSPFSMASWNWFWEHVCGAVSLPGQNGAFVFYNIGHLAQTYSTIGYWRWWIYTPFSIDPLSIRNT